MHVDFEQREVEGFECDFLVPSPVPARFMPAFAFLCVFKVSRSLSCFSVQLRGVSFVNYSILGLSP